MKTIYFLVLFVLNLKVSSSIAQTATAYKSSSVNTELAVKVDKLMAQYNLLNTPGVAVSIVKDGAIVYKKGVGIANLEYGIPITASTVFHVASLSKQFTIFSILLLEQEGKLSIDDDIRKYLPEMSNYGHTITLRNLANHTSGIRDNTDLANLVGIKENDMLSNEEAVKLIMNQKGLNFIPGSEFEYCNSGYILLAEIVKRVSGQSFAEFTANRIFKPLKMRNSQFVDDAELVVKNKAYSYYKPDNIYYKSILNHSIVGSTGLNTTICDLSLWAQNFEKQIIGNKTLFSKMEEKGKLSSGEIIPYAMGQELKQYKGLNIIFHGGGDAAYRSYLIRVPEHKFSVVIMGNKHSFNPLDIAYTIVDYYLKEKETVTNVHPNPTPINQALLQNHVGDYEIFQGMIISICRDNDTLFLQVKGDSNKVKLPTINNYEFIYPNMPHSKIVFSQNSNELKWHASDFTYKGQRIELKEFDKNKINLFELAGQYYSSELKTIYNFEVKENKLVATHYRNEDFYLSASQPDIFRSDRSYFTKVEFIRNEQKAIIGCFVSGQKIRRIKFQKITCN